MTFWKDFDAQKTIQEYEFTNRAVASMTEVLHSEDFASMDAEAIFSYLSGKMEVVSFGDFLKRYIYEKTEIETPYPEVPDYVYQETVLGSFEDNKAPFSLTKTKSRKSAMVKKWLSSSMISRNTVFVLGFGLRMPAEDVSVFLTKCILEEDFDFNDPTETIYWYAFENGLSYAQTRKLFFWYEQADPEASPRKTWESMNETPKEFLKTPENLAKYLRILKERGLAEEKEEASYEEFMTLYGECCGIVSSMHNDDVFYIDGGHPICAAEVSPADLERELYSGIPVTKEGNLEAMVRSRFASLFRYRRMSRQRISALLSRRFAPDRYDLITLLFFIYAQTVEPDNPKERCCQFIDQINEILNRCRLYGIYPVNPYESFILMCLATEVPMDVYAEIWEKSYQM